jgi:hypothetical protein
MIVIFFGFIIFGLYMMFVCARWATKHPTSSDRLRRRVVWPLFAAALSIAAVLQFYSPTRSALSDAAVGLLVAALGLFCLAAMLTIRLSPHVQTVGLSNAARTFAERVKERFRELRRSNPIQAYLLMPFLASLLIFQLLAGAFVGAVYLQWWPMEFGGVKAKCVVLDLVIDELSPTARSWLIPATWAAVSSEPTTPAVASAASAPAVPKVEHSRVVAVYSSSAPWFVRAPRPSDQFDPSPASLRLPESVVRSVRWLPDKTYFSFRGNCFRRDAAE